MEDARTCDLDKKDASDSSKKGTDLPPATISDLPDDLLVSILSHLTTKEAASTSLVTRRWRSLRTQLWTWRTELNFDGWDILSPSWNSEAASTSLVTRIWRSLQAQLWTWRTELNFDGWDILSPSWNLEDEEDPLRVGFVKFVNQVLREHHGKTVDEFRIRFSLNKYFTHEIDRWVEFAFAKGVKRFELDFASDRRGFCSKGIMHYNFLDRFLPQDILPEFPMFLGLSRLEVAMFERPNLLPPDFPSSNRLEALYLKYVDVSQEVLENLIANCPRLEVLHVEASSLLFGLRVSGPSLPLKHLELCRCVNMKNLEISAPNLVSFTLIGSKYMLNLKSAPLLTNLSLGVDDGQSLGVYDGPRIPLLRYFRAFRCCSNQLETLEFKDLELHGLIGWYLIPDFPRLKKFTVHIYTDDSDEYCVSILRLIEAAPSLHEFRMMLGCRPTSRRIPIRRSPRHRHQCLKLVEIVGFIGRDFDVEFVLFIFKNAVSLEKMILDSRNPGSNGMPSKFVKTFEKSIAKLKDMTPAGVELLIR